MINRKLKKLILLPPKTGTISIESLFKNDFCGYSSYSRSNPVAHIHMYLDEAIENYSIKDIENWEIYQTARNPMDRIVSAFLHQKRILRQLGKKVDHMKFENFIERVNEHHYLLPEKERTFAAAVLSKDDIITKQHKSSRGVRFYIPQTSWADSDKYNVKYIKLGEDNSKIYKDMGLPEDLELPFLNQSKLDKSKYKHLHTNKTKKIIKSLYENDFLKINYEKDWIN
jgi:hypothetical protein|tara:strand:- start:1001 stop:1681 length:681 start_codon:yes stop_codon:yes gene_type:complete